MMKTTINSISIVSLIFVAACAEDERFQDMERLTGDITPQIFSCQEIQRDINAIDSNLFALTGKHLNTEQTSAELWASANEFAASIDTADNADTRRLGEIGAALGVIGALGSQMSVMRDESRAEALLENGKRLVAEKNRRGC